MSQYKQQLDEIQSIGASQMELMNQLNSLRLRVIEDIENKEITGLKSVALKNIDEICAHFIKNISVQLENYEK